MYVYSQFCGSHIPRYPVQLAKEPWIPPAMPMEQAGDPGQADRPPGGWTSLEFTCHGDAKW